MVEPLYDLKLSLWRIVLCGTSVFQSRLLFMESICSHQWEQILSLKRLGANFFLKEKSPPIKLIMLSQTFLLMHGIKLVFEIF